MRRMQRLAIAAALIMVGLAGGVSIASQRSAAAMSAAAGKWLASLSAEQRTKAVFPFDSDERFRWHYIPNEMFERKGLTIKEMSEPQRALAHDLLKTGLTPRPYLTPPPLTPLHTLL